MYGIWHISHSASHKFSIVPVTSPVQHGEGPIWDGKTQSLYYVDTFKATLLKWKSLENKTVYHQFDGDSIGFVIPVRYNRNTFIVCRDRYIDILNWNGLHNNTGVLRHMTYVDHSWANNQFNDGKVDANGRLWAGTLTRNKDLSVSSGGGSLYMIHGGCGLTVEKKLSPISISNGIAWSKDNRKMFYIDSETRRIDGYDFNLITGSIGYQRTVLDLANYPEIKGIPDGMTIDTDDNLWVAIYGGKLILQVNSTSGEIQQRITMPATYVTSVAFGGDNLDILYATTSRLKLTPEEILQEPLAGSVFAIHNLGVRGHSAHHYQF
ncbi:regucalcin-like isoform X2 [Photinus pyralis]|uniref:regucalcin-like isoform X2 n=1 Tax=Photinus pyralis TaxID=7054 RepID=UPI0012671708|nr:regucalcin-like isoform X2 [Photinus pyralis]